MPYSIMLHIQAFYLLSLLYLMMFNQMLTSKWTIIESEQEYLTGYCLRK